jgi:prepilin-type N-terminal cleavage/methylation domain-containing protein
MRIRNQIGRARRGFTLLELVIATALLSLVLGAVGLVQMRAADASRAGMAREQIETQCRRALNRVADELQGVGHNMLFPDPSSNLGATSLTYQHPIAVSNTGIVTWDSPSTIALQLEPGETDNGLDDNGDGLVDERRLVLTRNAGSPNAVTTVLCSGVPEMGEGETANGLDDNGNGVVDEAGFNVRRVGDLLTVRLAVQGRGKDGELITTALQTSVVLHN